MASPTDSIISIQLDEAGIPPKHAAFYKTMGHSTGILPEWDLAKSDQWQEITFEMTGTPPKPSSDPDAEDDNLVTCFALYRGQPLTEETRKLLGDTLLRGTKTLLDNCELQLKSSLPRTDGSEWRPEVYTEDIALMTEGGNSEAATVTLSLSANKLIEPSSGNGSYEIEVQYKAVPLG